MGQRTIRDFTEVVCCVVADISFHTQPNLPLKASHKLDAPVLRQLHMMTQRALLSLAWLSASHGQKGVRALI